MLMAQPANPAARSQRYVCRINAKKTSMKTVTRQHRILAVITGIAIVVILIIQILHDGRVF